MSAHDNNVKRKMILDDTHTLSCLIEAAENVQGYTVYIMKVQRGHSESLWQVSRRYSDFDALNNLLLCSGLDIPLPPKKVFGKLEREFIAERQQALQVYVNFLTSHPLLSSSIHVKKFLDPKNYSFNFVETSLQHVSMVFRSEPQWEIVEPLIDFGWRIRKQYFSIKSKNETKKLFVLSWMAHGPDQYLNEKDLSTAVKLLGSIQHPCIVSTSMCCVSSNGALVIYDFFENGSLRDFLYKAKPRVQFLKKYGNPKFVNVLLVSKVKEFAFQILTGLKFLHDRGFYHGSVHSGNVAIVDGRCKLFDIFNGVLGLPSFLRPHIIQLKKIQTMQNVDVYCFGHLLYEMVFGTPLYETTCDKLPNSCASDLRSLLLSLLSKEGLKSALPSIADLLQHPFFLNSTSDVDKIHLKVPSQLKESLKKAQELTEKRLKEDQKVLRHSKRISKVHAQLSCDDERKKRSKERKHKSSQELVNSTSSERSQTPSTPTVVSDSDQALTPSTPVPPPFPPSLVGDSKPVTAVPNIGAPPPPPPPPIPAPATSQQSGGRVALLNSIQGFNKGALKKAETKDCSVPKL